MGHSVCSQTPRRYCLVAGKIASNEITEEAVQKTSTLSLHKERISLRRPVQIVSKPSRPGRQMRAKIDGQTVLRSWCKIEAK
jgi:hypothetical protein